MRWSIVMPVYNERDYLKRTLLSLARQRRRFHLIIVDNGSVDGSRDVAERLSRQIGLDAIVVSESVPGVVPALARGLALVETELVATCDADTLYPARYLETAERMFDRNTDANLVAAYYVPPGATRRRAIAAALHQLGAARILRRQAHNGAAGQSFRTAALRASGGYDVEVWPYVLGDQEIVHRMLKGGPQLWSRDHWCVPSDRRRNGNAVRWSAAERTLYHLTPFALKDWYFYDFLSTRLERRGLDSSKLRDRGLSSRRSPDEGPHGIASHALR
jgi:glycosyltransferase involved in cell wall biosynthesis